MKEDELSLEKIPEVSKLIQIGKSNSEITYDEINDILPDKVSLLRRHNASNQ